MWSRIFVTEGPHAFTVLKMRSRNSGPQNLRLGAITRFRSRILGPQLGVGIVKPSLLYVELRWTSSF
jgi:hypothetical protein